MKFRLFIFALLLANLSAAQTDIPAHFPGGDEAYNQYMTDHLVYPEKAISSQSSRLIKALVAIDTLGNLRLQNFITPNSGVGFEEEVERFIQTMPQWIPAVHDGRIAKTQIILTFNFTYIDPEIDYEEIGYEYYVKSEIPPSFPGGNDSLKKWVEGYLSDSLQLQFDTAQASFEFVVTSQGNAIDISLTSTNSAIADQYWLFAMDRMPKWNPGKIKGKDVFVKHSITLEIIRRKS